MMQISGKPEEFLTIPLHTLRLGTTTDFEMYLPGPPGKPPVLYRGRSLPFHEEDMERLSAHRVENVLVPLSDSGAYRLYVESNLGQILSDTAVPLEERCTVLYSSAQSLVKSVLEDPRSGTILERSGAVVGHMVGFLYREKRSFHHLMRLTSFDYYTYTHSVNVFVFSTGLAQRLGYPEAEVQEFGQGGLLHDLGKSQIDPEIVNFKGKLSDEQFRIMKQHPGFGHQLLLEQGEVSQVILDVTRHHHEKLNGRGYPDGLAAAEISRWARIATIADIFDALSTRRSYKSAMNSFESLRLMKDLMAEEIDMKYFRAFVELMSAA
jgi:HD-GYP domain-containing protein (c-di-GMP phosphodiesterase class II)